MQRKLVFCQTCLVTVFLFLSLFLWYSEQGKVEALDNKITLTSQKQEKDKSELEQKFDAIRIEITEILHNVKEIVEIEKQK